MFVNHPDTKGLLEQVNSRVDLEIAEQVHFVRSFLAKFQSYDIEHVYDFIDHMINLKEHDNPNASNNIQYVYSNDTISYPDMIEIFKKLKTIIRQVLVTSFKTTQKDHDSIKTVFDKVWNAVNDGKSNTFQIITTNYDQVIDQYSVTSNWKLVNGFGCPDNMGIKYWKNEWSFDTNEPTLQLIRLHGSVTWQKVEDSDEIIELGRPGMRSGDMDVMILPKLGPKQYDKSPFEQLYNRFKEVLDSTDTLVVIGFSFRDMEINSIIKQNLGKGMNLILISPNSSVMSNISASKEEPIERRRLEVTVKYFKSLGVGAFAYETKFEENNIDLICDIISKGKRERGHYKDTKWQL